LVVYPTNLKSRIWNYRTHNIDAELVGYVEVPGKKYERFVHLTLLSKYFPCRIKGKTEWMEGYIDIKTFTNIVNEEIKKNATRL
jgi:hypothetical protein